MGCELVVKYPQVGVLGKWEWLVYSFGVVLGVDGNLCCPVGAKGAWIMIARREIVSHKISGLNDAICVASHDEPGSSGAHHHYTVGVPGVTSATILFHDEAVKEGGFNGISNEALLAVVIDRLQCFQKGVFSCEDGALALAHLEEAMYWLHQRTRERMQRSGEGTHTK